MIYIRRWIALIFLIIGLGAHATLLEAGFIPPDARALSRSTNQCEAALTRILNNASHVDILRWRGQEPRVTPAFGVNIFLPPRPG